MSLAAVRSNLSTARSRRRIIARLNGGLRPSPQQKWSKKDILFEGGAHELGGAALRHVAGKHHGAGGVIGTDDGPHDLAPVRPGDAEREQQRRAGKAICLIAQITLVEVERRFVVEPVEHIVAGPCDPASRPERLPAAVTAVTDDDGVAI